MPSPRLSFRSVLIQEHCLTPASVYDPVSARIAEEVGFSTGILAGSVAAHQILAAPDWMLVTLTELAQLVRQITRASTVALLVDADHGFGNPLNVVRCVEELEAAGAQALTIEDTLLPPPYHGSGGETLISRAEACAKLRAALQARTQPATVIVGRTACLRIEGLEETIARLQAFEQCGVDALMVVGLKDLRQLEAIAQSTRLPLLSGPVPPSLDAAQLAAHRVRWRITGHQPYAIALSALAQAYRDLYQHGDPAKYTLAQAGSSDMQRWMRGDYFASLWQNFMDAPR